MFLLLLFLLLIVKFKLKLIFKWKLFNILIALLRSNNQFDIPY